VRGQIKLLAGQLKEWVSARIRRDRRYGTGRIQAGVMGRPGKSSYPTGDDSLINIFAGRTTSRWVVVRTSVVRPARTCIGNSTCYIGGMTKEQVKEILDRAC